MELMNKIDILSDYFNLFEFPKLIYVGKPNFKEYNALIVSVNDKVYAIGNGIYESLEVGRDKLSKQINVMEGLCQKNIVNIFCGSDFYFAHSRDDKIYCWGDNIYGQLAINTKNSDWSPKLNEYLSNRNLEEICCGLGHSLALTKNGEVFGWGHNRWGQIGIGNRQNQCIPIKLKRFLTKQIVQISCGAYHSMALTDSGIVFTWGSNHHGQLGLSQKEFIIEPKMVIMETLIEKVKCHSDYSLLLSRDGAIYVFGNNIHGQLGIGNRVNQSIPFKLKIDEKFIEIESKFNVSVAKSENGVIYFWGHSGENSILTPTATQHNSFQDVFTDMLQITLKPIYIQNALFSQ